MNKIAIQPPVVTIMTTLVFACSGCWFSFTPEGRLCGDDSHCLEGYACRIGVGESEGSCERASSDAGTATIDAGTVVADAGTMVADAGTMVADAGTIVADAGAIVADASASDAGPACLGAGPRLAVGDRFACGISAGRVLCWGFNGAGRLGFEATPSGTTLTPVEVEVDVGDGSQRWVSVAASHNHACALSCEGEVWCWGGDRRSVVGRAASASILLPGPVEFGDDTTNRRFRTIAASKEGSCGVGEDGTAYCWGIEDDVLGVSGGSPVTSPRPVSGMDNVEGLECGRTGCCAQRGSQTHCWGRAGFGAIASQSWYDAAEPRPAVIRTPAPQVGGPYRPIALGTQNTCGVSAGGSLHCWGDPYDSPAMIKTYTEIFGPEPDVAPSLPLRPQEVWDPATGTTIVDVALTGDAICALLEAGPGSRTMYCWGAIGSPSVDGTISRPRVFREEITDWLELSNSTIDSWNNDDDSICGLRATGDVLCIGTRLGADTDGHEALFFDTMVTLEL